MSGASREAGEREAKGMMKPPVAGTEVSPSLSRQARKSCRRAIPAGGLIASADLKVEHGVVRAARTMEADCAGPGHRRGDRNMVKGRRRGRVVGGPARGLRNGQGTCACEKGVLMPQVNTALFRRIARGRRHQIEVPEGIAGMLGGWEGDEGLEDADAVIRG